MMMPFVPTHMDHSTVLVMLDLLEMVSIAQVQYAGIVWYKILSTIFISQVIVHQAIMNEVNTNYAFA